MRTGKTSRFVATGVVFLSALFLFSGVAYAQVNVTMAVNDAAAGDTTAPGNVAGSPYPQTVGVGFTVTAAANPGYSFVNWTFTGTGIDNVNFAGATSASTTATITAEDGDNALTITANFSANSVNVTMAVNDAAAGDTTAPGNVAGSPYVQTVGVGFTVTAVANPGYSFVNWTFTGTGADNVSFANANLASTTATITAEDGDNALTITANFSANSVNVTMAVNDPAGGDTTAPGNVAGSPYVQTVGVGFTVTAVANAGWRFDSWTFTGTGADNVSFGDANAASTTATITAEDGDNALTITANFVDIVNVTMAVNDAAAGDTTAPGNVAGSPYQEDIDVGFTVTAAPNPGYSFVNWTFSGTGADNVTFADANASSTTATVRDEDGDDAVTITANFIGNNINVTMAVSDAAAGDTTAPGNVAGSPYVEVVGTGFTVTAVANPGYSFVNWTFTGTGSDNVNFGDANAASTTATISAEDGDNALTITANFSANSVNVTMAVNDAAAGDTTAPGNVAGSPYSETVGVGFTVTAAANPGYSFVNWTFTGTGADNVNFASATAASTTATITAEDGDNALTITANFVGNSINVTMAVSDAAAGDTSAPGNVAGSPYVEVVGAGFTVTAVVNPGYSFVNWTFTGTGVDNVNFGDANAASTTATISAEDGDNALTITANFAANSVNVTMAVNDAAGGDTTAPGNVAGSPYVQTVGVGFTVTAVANAGWRFDNWTFTGTGADNVSFGDANAASTTATITAEDGDNALTITANFADTVEVTMAVNDAAAGDTTAPGNVAGSPYLEDIGVGFTVTAVANAGWRFDNWSFSGTGVDNVTFGDASAASTTATVTDEDGDESITITANFVETVELTMAVDPPGGGTTTPAVGTTTIDKGVPYAISATAAAEFVFFYWSADPPADVVIDDLVSASTSVTLAADATVTANFAPLGTVEFSGLVTINGLDADVGDEVRVYDPDGVLCGIFVVTIAGQYGPLVVVADHPATPDDEGAEAGDVLDFRVYDTSAAREYGGYEVLADVITGEDPPEWTADGDAWQVDVHAADATAGLGITDLFISLNNKRANRDQAKIRTAAIPANLVLRGFNPALDDVMVVIDGFIFDIPAGSFGQTSPGLPIYRYRTAGNAIPRIEMLLDFVRGRWSFSVRRTNLTGIDNSDGIDILLAFGTDYNGENYDMEENSRWQFSSRNNLSSAVATPYPDMAAFSIQSARGTYKNRPLGARKDRVQIGRAMLQLPGGVVFDQATDEVEIAVDKLIITIPAGSFVQRGRRRPIYIYRTARGASPAIRVKLDFYRGLWSFRLTNGSAAGISSTNGVVVLLRIGGYQSGLLLDVFQMTKLRYRD